MSEQKLEALGGQLKRSIKKLNSEFDTNHKPLNDKIKELNYFTDELKSMHNKDKQKKLRENIMKITSDFINTVNPMIELLSTISNTIEELQQKYSVQNKAIMTSVRSVKTFSSVTNPSPVLQTETVTFVFQMRKTAAKFQETLDEIKTATETINKELQIS